MDERAWQRVKQVFHEAAARPTAERGAFVREACGDDAALRAEVEELLAAHAEAGEPGAPDARGTLAEAAGTSIGPYKLLQRIGEGGFGVVYMAEQTEPVRRVVALKIIKLGMDTRQVIVRFEAERQALALMDHPNIARVLDAGATSSGRPYFVMELVKGVPITEYCDSNHLSTRERLELFIDVCHAVRHAHQKGVIHRDIKPSNVMVTLHDGVPVPKVIDFGIAKATAARLTDKTLFTEFKQFLGTPEYMSPEQAEMSGLDIDTRADIYSLGVLLYELLTGTTPFDAQTLRAAAFDEILRIIREEEPPRPSTRVSTLGERSTAVAKLHHSEPKALRRLLLGDLDWIVMKALEKDRTRRYESADGLAQDVERHLRDEPVLASPPSAVYKLRKFARRNRAMLGALGAIAAALVIGLAAATFGLLRARGERDKARSAEVAASRAAERTEKVNSFLRRFLAAPGSPAISRESSAVFRPDVQVVEVVDDMVRSLDAELASEPEIEAEVRLAIGESYLNLSRYAEAETQLRRGLALRREITGGDDLVSMRCLSYLGNALSWQGNFAEAEDCVRRALDGCRRLAGERSEETLQAEIAYVFFLMDKRRPEAEPLARHAVELARELHGAEEETLQAQAALAFVLSDTGKLDEAEVLAKSVLAVCERTPEQRVGRKLCRIVLGNCALARGAPLEAEGYFREVLDIAAKTGEGELFGGTIATARIATALKVQDRWAEAEPYFRQASAAALRIFGGAHPYTFELFADLARSLHEQGKEDETEATYRELADVCAGADGADRPSFGVEARRLLARHLLQTGRAGEAEPLVRAVVDARRAELDDVPSEVVRAENLVRALGTWGSTLVALHREDEGDAAFREALEVCDAKLVDPNLETLDGFEGFAIVLDRQGRFAEAESLTRRVLDGRRRKLGEDDASTLLAENNLAWMLFRLGRFAEAEPLARAALDGDRRLPETTPRRRMVVLDTAASILTKLGRLEEAQALFAEIEGLEGEDPGKTRPEPEILVRHAECLIALAKRDDAERRLLEAHALLDSQGLDRSAEAHTVAQRLAELYAGAGRAEEAQEWLAKSAGK